jgi:hypothetical protein
MRPLEPWEREWLDHRAEWDREMNAVPGVFACLTAMHAMDAMEPEAWRAWWNLYGDAPS